MGAQKQTFLSMRLSNIIHPMVFMVKRETCDFFFVIGYFKIYEKKRKKEHNEKETTTPSKTNNQMNLTKKVATEC